MQKSAALKIVSIHYGGESIGEDIRLEVRMLEKFFNLERRIKPGDTLTVNQEAGRFEVSQGILESELTVKIIEKDFLFNDVSQVVKKLTIDSHYFPYEFEVEIKVQERRVTFRKSTAVFTVRFVIDQASVEPKIRPYNPGPHGENYNVYDEQIEKNVRQWNAEFFGQQNPPSEPLDPNLVKAMMYAESKIGYYRPKEGYSGYPDVMQVADPRNDAIYTLQNAYNPNPGRKKKITEYEVINGKLQKLAYQEANGNSPDESIRWGARWLYHVAQNNISQGRVWTRTWKNWEDAAAAYNGGGDPEYKKKVLNAYRNGTGDKSYNLWSLSLVLLAGAGIIHFALYTGLTTYDRQTDKMALARPLVAGAEIDKRKSTESASNAFVFNGFDDIVKLRQEVYPPTNCAVGTGNREYGDVLGNCSYTVGGNWSGLWTVHLTDGGYAFTVQPYHNFSEYANVGPYSVTFENYAIGDLDGDGKDDAVVALKLTGGSVSHWMNLVVLVQDVQGMYQQVSNYMFKDREVIRGLNIQDGIITVPVMLKAEEDPACCASIYATYKFRLD